jgi:hypothetical protein
MIAEDESLTGFSDSAACYQPRFTAGARIAAFRIFLILVVTGLAARRRAWTHYRLR